MTITPQPQPASYWIDLLDELTDGWFSEATKDENLTASYDVLSLFLSGSFYWSRHELGWEFWDAMHNDAAYIESCQSVIDAAVEYEKTLSNTYSFQESIDEHNNMMKQVQLYKRCNGIKD